MSRDQLRLQRFRHCFVPWFAAVSGVLHTGATIADVADVAGVVINEVFYAPDQTCAQSEFIELYNPGASAVDLSGWRLARGVRYEIPEGTAIPPGGYLVIAQNPAVLADLTVGRAVVQVMGPWQGKLSNEGERIELEDEFGQISDRLDYKQSFPWPVAAGGEGDSMSLLNPHLDNALGGAWRSAPPSPGVRNPVYVDPTPPVVTHVRHRPRVPASRQPVRVEVGIHDPRGDVRAALHYQVVPPGHYIPARLPHPVSQLNAPGFSRQQPRPPNPEFESTSNWNVVDMNDDGIEGDIVAGDGNFSALVPGQRNRTLLRYRITVSDARQGTVRAPFADDPALNFAWYVYDGVPDYVAEDSVKGGRHVHTSDMLTTLPVYTLLTRREDIDTAMGYREIDRLTLATEGWLAYNWEGAFVYDGEVYDHIDYRLRGANGRYDGRGKRSLKFRFNRGRYFSVRNQFGSLYKRKWRVLEAIKMFNNHEVGGFGLVEAIDGYLWRLVGVPAPLTHWFHFRVVAGEDEAPDQWRGDFQGMLLAQERYDGRFLHQHGLAPGNLYKLTDRGSDESGLDPAVHLRYQACNGRAPLDGADFTSVVNRFNASRSEQWIRDRADLDRWYRWNAVKDAVRHYDLRTSRLKNSAWYFEPDYRESNDFMGRLWVLPYDYDVSWGPTWAHGWGTVRQVIQGNPRIDMEKKNALREFRDLVWQPDQIDLLIEYLAWLIRDFSFADRDRWSKASPELGQEDFGSLDDKVTDMKRFAWEGGRWPRGGDMGPGGRAAFLDRHQHEPEIPGTPVITYAGAPGYPIDGLAFESSSFDGTGFGAMEWRLAEITPLVSAIHIGKGSQWRYLDQGAAPRRTWRRADFDDSEWLTGEAPFGFGGVARLQFATEVRETNPDGERRITTYFRRQVKIEDPDDFDLFYFHLNVDDGAVVYVNGVEAVRDGFEYGTLVDHHSLAQQRGNEDAFDSFAVKPTMFTSGVNTIAVEIHQEARGSNDLAFDLALEGLKFAYPEGTVPKLEWNADWESGISREFSQRVVVPSGWARAGGIYRARVRHRDTSGRWGHWSAPAQFEAGTALNHAPERDQIGTEFFVGPPRP